MWARRGPHHGVHPAGSVPMAPALASAPSTSGGLQQLTLGPSDCRRLWVKGTGSKSLGTPWSNSQFNNTPSERNTETPPLPRPGVSLLSHRSPVSPTASLPPQPTRPAPAPACCPERLQDRQARPGVSNCQTPPQDPLAPARGSHEGTELPVFVMSVLPVSLYPTLCHVLTLQTILSAREAKMQLQKHKMTLVLEEKEKQELGQHKQTRPRTATGGAPGSTGALEARMLVTRRQSVHNQVGTEVYSLPASWAPVFPLRGLNPAVCGPGFSGTRKQRPLHQVLLGRPLATPASHAAPGSRWPRANSHTVQGQV